MSYLEYEIYPKLHVLKPLFPADGTTVNDDWVLGGKVDMSNIDPLHSVFMRGGSASPETTAMETVSTEIP